MSGVDASVGTDTSARLPPRVVRVPPPKVSPLPLGVMIWIWGLVVLIIQPFPFAFGWANVLYQVGLPACLVVGCVAESVARRRFNARRKQWLDEHDEVEADVTSEWLGRKWWIADVPPKLEVIRRTLGTSETAPATLVCMGAFDLPPIGDHRFEPVIVGQSQVGTQAQMVAGAFVVVGLLVTGAIANAWGGMPARLDEYWALLAMAAGVLVMWLWGFAIRPLYLRAAPGRLQVLRYPIGQTGPLIHDYPVAPGLLCVVIFGWRSLQITLSNKRATDELLLHGVGEEVLTRLWQALLSTAPTPPLDPDELVG